MTERRIVKIEKRQHGKFLTCSGPGINECFTSPAEAPREVIKIMGMHGVQSVSTKFLMALLSCGKVLLPYLENDLGVMTHF